jgi:hypothetical protein
MSPSGALGVRLRNVLPMIAESRRRVEIENPKRVLEEMRSAARALFRTRDPNAIYVFLEEAYRMYARVKDAGKPITYRKELAKLAGIAVHKETRLASVLVRASAPNKFSSSRASLLGGILGLARRRKIEPEDLENEITSAGGVSRAFMAWTRKPTSKPRKGRLAAKARKSKN